MFFGIECGRAGSKLIDLDWYLILFPLNNFREGERGRLAGMQNEQSSAG
jgi:hypothetical protein